MNIKQKPGYARWRGMINRCTNPNVDAYPWYGGRGIKVCQRWTNYDNFIADMGIPPKGMDLDRIDPDGDYEPMNCRWVSHSENCMNTSANRRIEWQGRRQTLTEWSRETGIAMSTIFNRLKRNYPLDLVFSKTVFYRKSASDPLRAVK